MRAKLDASALEAALRQGVAATRTTVPILCHALIEAEGEAVTCTTYNIAMRARTRIKASVSEAGSICADANVLRAAAYGGGEIEVSEGLVKRAKSRLKIPFLPVDQWPGADHIRWEPAGVNAAKLREAIDKVEFAVRPADIRGFCRCVVLVDGLCAGLDGFRASMIDIEYSGPTLFIPIDTIQQLRKRLVDDAEVHIGYVGDNQARFVAAGTERDRVEITLESATGVPPYRDLIPAREPEATAKVARRWLQTEVDRMAPFCVHNKAMGAVARFEVGDCLRLCSADGENAGEMTGEFSGAISMGLNLSQISDALGTSDDDYVTLEFHETDMPPHRSCVVIRDQARGHSQLSGAVTI